jgi:parallel beta-helix repeat protein
MLRPGAALMAAAALIVACGQPDSSPADDTSEGTVHLYVSPEGDDGNTGLSDDDPLATLAHAVSLAAPGTQIRVLPGTYHESLAVEGIGSADAPTWIMGWEGIPVFDGEGEQALGIFCDGCTNFVVTCLEITGYTDIGIGATGSTSLIFRDLIVHGNGTAVQQIDWEIEGYGIHVDDSSDVTIEYTDVFDNGPLPGGAFLLGTGINTIDVADVVISNNRSFRNRGGGILVEDGINVFVEANRVFENELDGTAEGWWDGGLWLDGGRDVVVRGNSFYDNNGPGIEISDEEGKAPSGYVLQDNVSSGNLFGVYIWNFGSNDWPADDVIFRTENDFSGNERIDVWIVP